jgi:hypothetical protein
VERIVGTGGDVAAGAGDDERCSPPRSFRSFFSFFVLPLRCFDLERAGLVSGAVVGTIGNAAVCSCGTASGGVSEFTRGEFWLGGGASIQRVVGVKKLQRVFRVFPYPLLEH